MSDKDTVVSAIDSYLDWRRARGIAPATSSRDRVTLFAFAKVTGNIKPASLTTEHVDRFFLDRSSLSPQTQNLDLATLRTFFSFLENRGYHRKAKSLLADYRSMKYAPPIRRRVSIGEFPALLDSAQDPRDRILVAIGIYLFLRASEVKLLRVKDVNLATSEVSVRIPKTKDADLAPLCSEMEAELRRWLTHYAETCGPLDPDWFLVPRLKLTAGERTLGGRFTSESMVRELIPTEPCNHPFLVIKRALKALGWKDVSKEGLHTLRRSGARALYDELASSDGHSNALETVSAMLHHSTMSVTQIYLGLTESRRKRDRLIAGKVMFPSLCDHTIVPLRSGQNTTHG